MSDRFDMLGQRIAEAQDRLRLDRRDQVRARLLALAMRAPARLRWLAIGGGLVVAMAAMLLVLAWPTARALSFEVGADQAHGTVGAWMSAPAERSELLRFSDGSEIELQPRAQARVAELDRELVRVVLERGAADVRIEKGGQRAWHIDAGPYLVIVTGTQFRVAWDPQNETFELDLREGAVIVEGPQTDGAREVFAGQSMRIAAPVVAARELEPRVVTPAPIEQPTTTPEEAAPEPPRSIAPKSRERARPVEVAPEPVAPIPSWRELADDGRYRDALVAAESLGFATLCTSLPDDQLLRLADVARFARRPARAIEALDAVRMRFADTDAAATAAFERGRIALGQRDHDDAAKWLATYLKERPSGALAREATGRLIEALQGDARDDEARSTARDYLSRYPKGPHADLATRVLAGGG